MCAAPPVQRYLVRPRPYPRISYRRIVGRAPLRRHRQADGGPALVADALLSRRPIERCRPRELLVTATWAHIWCSTWNTPSSGAVRADGLDGPVDAVPAVPRAVHAPSAATAPLRSWPRQDTLISPAVHKRDESSALCRLGPMPPTPTLDAAGHWRRGPLLGRRSKALLGLSPCVDVTGGRERMPPLQRAERHRASPRPTAPEPGTGADVGTKQPPVMSRQKRGRLAGRPSRRG